MQGFLQAHQFQIGRDAMFDLLSEHGLLVTRRKRKGFITTLSKHRFKRYPNIVKDFINDKSIQNSSYFDTDADTELLKNDFVLYLEKQKNSKDLLESNKLNLSENTKLLKSQFINKKLEISSKKDLLFKYIEDDYDLLDKKDLLIEKIKDLNLENISILLSSNYARNNFLKSLNLLDKIKKNSLDKKISQIF